MIYRFTANSIMDTRRLAEALAQVVPDGMTIGLCGTLGAGKTQLVRGLAEACGVPADKVVSPTFVLCQQYSALRSFDHMDVYRLHDEDEFLELGPEEYFASPAITIIEWADKVEQCLPPSRLMVHIEITGDELRSFTIQPHGEVAEGVVQELANRLDQ